MRFEVVTREVSKRSLRRIKFQVMQILSKLVSDFLQSVSNSVHFLNACSLNKVKIKIVVHAIFAA